MNMNMYWAYIYVLALAGGGYVECVVWWNDPLLFISCQDPFPKSLRNARNVESNGQLYMVCRVCRWLLLSWKKKMYYFLKRTPLMRALSFGQKAKRGVWGNLGKKKRQTLHPIQFICCTLKEAIILHSFCIYIISLLTTSPYYICFCCQLCHCYPIVCIGLVQFQQQQHPPVTR